MNDYNEWGRNPFWSRNTLYVVQYRQLILIDGYDVTSLASLTFVHNGLWHTKGFTGTISFVTRSGAICLGTSP